MLLVLMVKVGRLECNRLLWSRKSSIDPWYVAFVRTYGSVFASGHISPYFSTLQHLAWEPWLNSCLTQWWVFTVPAFLTVGHTRLGTFSCNFFPTFTDDVYLQFGISQCSDYCAYFILIVLRVRFSVNRRIYFITFPFCVEQIYSVAFFYLLPHWFHFMSF